MRLRPSIGVALSLASTSLDDLEARKRAARLLLAHGSDEQLLAWSEDTVSRRKYTIRFKNLKTGEVYEDVIKDSSGGMAWAGDNRTLFYVRKDPTTLRPHQVWRHVLGTPSDQDVKVFEESDESFYVGVGKTKSRR